MSLVTLLACLQDGGNTEFGDQTLNAAAEAAAASAAAREGTAPSDLYRPEPLSSELLRNRIRELLVPSPASGQENEYPPTGTDVGSALDFARSDTVYSGLVKINPCDDDGDKSAGTQQQQQQPGAGATGMKAGKKTKKGAAHAHRAKLGIRPSLWAQHASSSVDDGGGYNGSDTITSEGEHVCFGFRLLLFVLFCFGSSSTLPCPCFSGFCVRFFFFFSFVYSDKLSSTLCAVTAVRRLLQVLRSRLTFQIFSCSIHCIRRSQTERSPLR